MRKTRVETNPKTYAVCKQKNKTNKSKSTKKSPWACPPCPPDDVPFSLKSWDTFFPLHDKNIQLPRQNHFIKTKHGSYGMANSIHRVFSMAGGRGGPHGSFSHIHSFCTKWKQSTNPPNRLLPPLKEGTSAGFSASFLKYFLLNYDQFFAQPGTFNMLGSGVGNAYEPTPNVPFTLTSLSLSDAMWAKSYYRNTHVGKQTIWEKPVFKKEPENHWI